MVETKIFSHLSTTTAITVTSSVSTRIYPQFLPQEVGYPAISYYRVACIKDNTLQGYSGMENPHIQIDCWGETYKEAKSLSTRVHTAMNNATFTALLMDENDVYEDEIEKHRVSQHYSCWERE